MPSKNKKITPTFKCLLCFDEFPLNKKSSCPVCNKNSCIFCMKSYISIGNKMPQCFDPTCKAEWDRIVCINNTNLTYFRKTIRPIVERYIFEIEKAKIPEILDDIEPYKQLHEIEQKIQKGEGNEEDRAIR